MSELTKYIKEQTFQKIKLLDGRSLGIRCYLMLDEKEFLFAVESRRNEENYEDILKEECINLAKRCVDKPKIVDSLSESNLIYLLSELRKISKGVEVRFNYYCTNPECSDYVELPEELQKKEGLKGRSGTAFEGVIDLDSEEDVKINRLDSNPVVIGDFKYYIQEIPYNIRQKLDTKYLPDSRIREWTYNFVINSIKAIEPKGESKITKIDKKELMSFIDNEFDSEKFKEFSDKIAEKICNYSIKKSAKCPICGTIDEIVFNDLFRLMVF